MQAAAPARQTEPSPTTRNGVADQSIARLTAFGPLPRLSGSVSKLTFCPSSRPGRPDAWTAEICTNTSFSPPSGVMKPKPFAWLKNLTVPVCGMGNSSIPLLQYQPGYDPRWLGRSLGETKKVSRAGTIGVVLCLRG